MQESHPTTSLVPKLSQTPFYFSLVFLFGVIALSLGFLFFNNQLEDDILDQRSQIRLTKSNIEEISKDRKVIITKIEQTNTIRPSIDLRGLVRDFYQAASQANVRLKGFTVSNDVISTSVIATEADIAVHPDVAGTIIKMMRDYAVPGNGKRFSLEPISSISGTPEKRTTSIQFKVVPTPIP